MKTVFALVLSVVMLSGWGKAQAAPLRERAARLNLGSPSDTLDRLKDRLGFPGANLDMSRLQPLLRGSPPVDHRFYSSIYLKDLLGQVSVAMVRELQRGTPVDFNLHVDRVERVQEVKRQRNDICFSGFQRMSADGKYNRIVDTIFVKLVRPALNRDNATSIEAPASSSPTVLAVVQNDLVQFLTSSVGREKTDETLRKLGRLTSVDVVNGQVFRLHFQQSGKPDVQMSLSMLLTLISGEDEGFLATLECLDQILDEHIVAFSGVSTARNPRAIRPSVRELVDKYAEGAVRTPEYFRERLTILRLTSSYIKTRLRGALESNARLQGLDQRALKALLVAFLDWQKEEIPNPNSIDILNENFKSLIQAETDRARSEVLEAEYQYYRTVVRLIRLLEQTLDQQAIDQEQRRRDQELFRTR